GARSGGDDARREEVQGNPWHTHRHGRIQGDRLCLHRLGGRTTQVSPAEEGAAGSRVLGKVWSEGKAQPWIRTSCSTRCCTGWRRSSGTSCPTVHPGKPSTWASTSSRRRTSRARTKTRSSAPAS